MSGIERAINSKWTDSCKDFLTLERRDVRYSH